MWLKYFFITILFLFLALSQASFLPFFNIFGGQLNVIFILFFIIIFFAKKNTLSFGNIFLSVVAGFFTDVYSTSLFGSYIVSFLIIAFFIKKSLQNLKETADKYPFNYFILLFLVTFIFNELFVDLIFYLSYNLYPTNLGWIFLIEIVYNLIFATVVFYVYKKIFNKK